MFNISCSDLGPLGLTDKQKQELENYDGEDKITDFLEAVAGKGGHVDIVIKTTSDISTARIGKFSEDGKSVELQAWKYTTGEYKDTIDYIDTLYLIENSISADNPTQAQYAGTVTVSVLDIKATITGTVNIYGTKDEFILELNGSGTYKFFGTQNCTMTGLSQAGSGTFFNGFNGVALYRGDYNQ